MDRLELRTTRANDTKSFSLMMAARIFSLLPEDVSFVYGSLYVFRRECATLYAPDFDAVEDTGFGQAMADAGKRIIFVRDLEVVHLKPYTLVGFVRNDFNVPFCWSRLFLRRHGWRRVFRGNTGFAHSPKIQLASLAVAVLTVLLALSWFLGWLTVLPLFCAFLVWALLNVRFTAYLLREAGVAFALASISVTYIDNLVMTFGIACGLLVELRDLIAPEAPGMDGK